MVDIPNHEDSLRDLSKTSLVNNVTLILCWSAAEAARYLELYKSYEHANFSAIRGQQSTAYADRLVDFVTVPRSLNKSDAVAMVANFGSLRNAVNADVEQLGMISGWGGIKVKKWSSAVEEPFRAKKAKKRGMQRTAPSGTGDAGQGHVPLREASSMGASSREPTTNTPQQDQYQLMGDINDDEEDALLAAAIEESKKTAQPQTSRTDGQSSKVTESQGDDELGGGVAAALAKLREGGG